MNRVSQQSWLGRQMEQPNRRRWEIGGSMVLLLLLIGFLGMREKYVAVPAPQATHTVARGEVINQIAQNRALLSLMTQTWNAQRLIDTAHRNCVRMHGATAVVCNQRYMRFEANSIWPGQKLEIPTLKASEALFKRTYHEDGEQMANVAIIVYEQGSGFTQPEQQLATQYLYAIAQEYGTANVYMLSSRAFWVYQNVRSRSAGAFTAGNTPTSLKALLESVRHSYATEIVLITDEKISTDGLDTGDLPPILVHCLKQDDGKRECKGGKSLARKTQGAYYDETPTLVN